MLSSAHYNIIKIRQKMGTDLIVPEITLIKKLEEIDNTTLPPAIWQQMRNNVAIYDEDKKLPASSRIKRRMLFSDFINKAINFPIEASPELNPDVERQLYRLHLFCCQQTIHNPEVRHNPLVLGFRALEEMHTALIAIFISYRLIHPECPYSWSRELFQNKIVTHKGPDGHIIISFKRPLTADIVNTAISEDIVTDWLIYRSAEHNGIRTLMDIKNNLIDLPDFKRGGNPEAEFSRFERKMQEKRNKKKEQQNDALELEVRKKIVETVTDKAVEQILASGVSAMELLNQAFNGDISTLIGQAPTKIQSSLPKEEPKKKLSAKSKDTKEIENVIAGFLEDKD